MTCDHTDTCQECAEYQLRLRQENRKLRLQLREVQGVPVERVRTTVMTATGCTCRAEAAGVRVDPGCPLHGGTR